MAKALFVHCVEALKQLFDHICDLELCVPLNFQHVILQIAVSSELVHNVYEVLVIYYLSHFRDTRMTDVTDWIHLAFMDVFYGQCALA